MIDNTANFLERENRMTLTCRNEVRSCFKTSKSMPLPRLERMSAVRATAVSCACCSNALSRLSILCSSDLSVSAEEHQEEKELWTGGERA